MVSRSLRQQQQQPQPMVHIPRRKVACSGCRHLKAHCRQPPESNSGDALRTCLRCLGFGLRCDLLDNDVQLSSPGQRKVGFGGRVASRSSLAAPKLALGPSSPRGKLTIHQLSNALAYHLITTHLQSSTGILLGASQAFACVKDVADTTALMIKGKPVSLLGLDSLLELSYMLQGARSSIHSALVDHHASHSASTIDHPTQSLVTLHSRRAQAITLLEDQFIDQLAALWIEDDADTAQDRIATFALVSEAVALSPRSRASEAVKKYKLLERAVVMTRQSREWSYEQNEEIYDWLLELILRSHFLSGAEGPAPLSDQDLAHSFCRNTIIPEGFRPDASSTSQDPYAWARALVFLDAPIFRRIPQESFLALISSSASLSSSSPQLLPLIQQYIGDVEHEERWVASTLTRLQRQDGYGNAPFEKITFKALIQYERWNLYQILSHYGKPKRSSPPQGDSAKRALMEEIETRIMQGFKARIRSSVALMEGSKRGKESGWTASNELRSEAWVMRIALERMGVEDVLKALDGNELDVLLMCFAIVARDDLSLVPLVKVIEEKIVRRRTPIYGGDLAPAIVEAALADLV